MKRRIDQPNTKQIKRGQNGGWRVKDVKVSNKRHNDKGKGNG